MVPRRIALIVLVGAALATQARGQQSPHAESRPGTASPETAAAIEDRPYKIRAFVSFDPMTRIDARGASGSSTPGSGWPGG